MAKADPNRPIALRWDIEEGYSVADPYDKREITEAARLAVEGWIAERNTWIADENANSRHPVRLLRRRRSGTVGLRNAGAVAGGADCVIRDCVFDSNSATDFGGAVTGCDEITDCRFVDNTAGEGGAIAFCDQTPFGMAQ